MGSFSRQANTQPTLTKAKKPMLEAVELCRRPAIVIEIDAFGAFLRIARPFPSNWHTDAPGGPAGLAKGAKEEGLAPLNESAGRFKVGRDSSNAYVSRTTTGTDPLADYVTPEIRSRMMSAIRGKDTIPELAIRRGLHALGLRYSLHSRRFPGRPDLVLPKHRAVIWVHGCYWHGHSCGEAKLPSSNTAYWSPKIAKNRERDARNLAAVESAGWRSLVIWECSFRRKGQATLQAVIKQAANWLRSGEGSDEISR
jgi:DNA mismatch endonuclease (patch repair protein)